ncbi:unnamed protein product [Candidula unifasciata]|uniref:Coactosin-like protein n=1 Tax=Candidula unifasciata TaxID=100452 RepID=A0A8S3YWV0_9EUPU|nr:unnamed protein product [Candidula unifasciata]
MSTEVVFEDESEFIATVSDIRNDNSEIAYVVCGHIDGNPNLIKILFTGKDTSEISSKMDPNEAMYVLARYEVKFDQLVNGKFIYIHWIGENVPIKQKGRYIVVRGSVEPRFSPYHLQVEASNPEDLDSEKMFHMLNETTGITSRVIETVEVPPWQMRGFTQTQLPQREKKTHFDVVAVSAKGAEVDVLPDVFEAVSKVRSDDDPATWMVAGYMDANPDGPIQCIDCGEGGLDDLTGCLEDLTPMYGLFRVTHTDSDDITTIKFVYIVWIGTDVKPLTKAKVSTHKGMAEALFGPVHVRVYASEISDINENNIMDKIRQQAAQ